MGTNYMCHEFYQWIPMCTCIFAILINNTPFIVYYVRLKFNYHVSIKYIKTVKIIYVTIDFKFIFFLILDKNISKFRMNFFFILPQSLGTKNILYYYNKTYYYKENKHMLVARVFSLIFNKNNYCLCHLT